MKRFWLLLFTIVFVCSALNISAKIHVKVSGNYSSIDVYKKIVLAPGKLSTVWLPKPKLDDQYFIKFKANEKDKVFYWLLDGKEANSPSADLLLEGTFSSNKNLELPKKVSEKGFLLALGNKQKYRNINLELIVFRVGKRSKELTNAIKTLIENAVKGITNFYHVPDFNIYVMPCGISNAFSAPDIIICTELLSDLNKHDLNNALIPILLHELAHSLLNLWNLPGYNNEDIADEFVVVYLGEIEPFINDFEKFLIRNDPISEALVIIYKGDRHSLSIQRVRNLRENLKYRDELIKRWAHLLSPFAKKVTNSK